MRLPGQSTKTGIVEFRINRHHLIHIISEERDGLAAERRGIDCYGEPLHNRIESLNFQERESHDPWIRFILPVASKQFVETGSCCFCHRKVAGTFIRARAIANNIRNLSSGTANRLE